MLGGRGALRKIPIIPDLQNSNEAGTAAGNAVQRAATKDRVTALAGLVQWPGSDSRFLGPAAIAVPSEDICHLRLTPAGSILKDVPACIILDRSPSIVGRNSRSGANILLDSPLEQKLISQLHAVFRYVSPCPSASSATRVRGGWEIFDLSSLNGTVVNGVRESHSWLADGDRIVFGVGGKVKYGGQWKEGHTEGGHA